VAVYDVRLVEVNVFVVQLMRTDFHIWKSVRSIKSLKYNYGKANIKQGSALKG
jgi:hypothetical protein